MTIVRWALALKRRRHEAAALGIFTALNISTCGSGHLEGLYSIKDR
jgi:hypothetical protein